MALHFKVCNLLYPLQIAAKSSQIEPNAFSIRMRAERRRQETQIRPSHSSHYTWVVISAPDTSVTVLVHFCLAPCGFLGGLLLLL